MKIPLLALIFQGIPEVIAIITLAYVIANVPLVWKKIIPAGILLAFVSYGVRLLPITFGVHTIILIGLTFFILMFLGKSSVNPALIASIISMLAITVAEAVCLSLLMPLFGVTSEILFTNTIIRILISWPQVLVMLILAFVTYKFKTQREIKKKQQSIDVQDGNNQKTVNKF